MSRGFVRSEAVRSKLTWLALVTAAFVPTGCGGGGDSAETATDGAGPTARGAADDGAYELCAPGLQETAQVYAVEPTKEAVAKVITELVSGGQPRDEEAARAGCLDALDAFEKKQK